MSRKSHRDQPTDRERATIADRAAALIEEGETDYRLATQKAAKQLALNNRVLPDANEIDAALRRRQALFSAESQPHALAALRIAALNSMRELESFSPWLVGPVLSGTANEFSEIELELIAVEPKHFEMFLLDKGIDFEARDGGHHSAERGHPASPVAEYLLDMYEWPVAVKIFEHHAARQRAFPPSHLMHDRAQREEAAQRFQEEK
jgi:hypothetical protein